MLPLTARPVHWRGPLLMVGSLLTGTLLVLAHHLFYASLAGKAVGDVRYDQQWNVRISTGISYLVRCALVIAIGLAYWQLFWGVVLRRRLAISTIDSLAGVLNDLTDLLYWKSIRSSPLLVALGALSWLIPLAVIVPPATLTVSSIEILKQRMLRLDAVDWETGSVARKPLYEEVDAVPYNGPAKEVARLLSATALQGQLPLLPFPGVNSTYSIRMPAPAVQCHNVASFPILSSFDEAMGTDVFCAYTNVTCLNQYSYLSWTPDKNSIVPFAAGSMNSSTAGSIPVDYPSYITGTSSYLGSYHPDWTGSPATLFVATRTQQEQDWTTMNCSLWNATYFISFEFENGRQNVTVLSTELHNAISLHFIKDLDAPQSLFSYQAMMESLGKVLVGSIHWTVSSDKDFITTTAATQTELAFTPELFPTYNGSLVTINTNTGQDGPASYSSVFEINQTATPPPGSRHLNVTIEQLFQNMTLSLFSRPEYLGTMTTATNVTIKTWANVYEYASAQLWLSYGLALGVSLVAVLAGLAAVWVNHASFSNRFSTILRTTCGDEVYNLVDSRARTGEEPVPLKMRHALVGLGSGLDARTMESKQDWYSMGETSQRSRGVR